MSETQGGQLNADKRWTVNETGGGCTALTRSVSDKKEDTETYWMITDQAEAPESMDRSCTLGLYVDGECVGTWDCGTVWAALAIANGMTEGG